MALLVNDQSYSGKVAKNFWLPATYGMDTLVKGAAYVVDGIKKTHTIERLDFSAPLQARAATPVSSGNFTLDGKVLDPKETMVYTEFNPRSLEFRLHPALMKSFHLQSNRPFCRTLQAFLFPNRKDTGMLHAECHEWFYLLIGC